MDLIGLGAVLGDFFEDGSGPSHDQLDQAFARARLSAGDPAPGGKTPQGSPLGKTKRMRQIFVYATDHDAAAGVGLARHVVSLLRSDGASSPGIDGYAGGIKIQRLREAFAPVGFTLDESGALRPTVIDNLVGTELTDALRVHINRINLNPDDAPLQIGAGKDLDEAAARHVLQERTGTYPVGGQAGSSRSRWRTPSQPWGSAFQAQSGSAATRRAMQDCLFL